MVFWRRLNAERFKEGNRPVPGGKVLRIGVKCSNFLESSHFTSSNHDVIPLQTITTVFKIFCSFFLWLHCTMLHKKTSQMGRYTGWAEWCGAQSTEHSFVSRLVAFISILSLVKTIQRFPSYNEQLSNKEALGLFGILSCSSKVAKRTTKTQHPICIWGTIRAFCNVP